MKHASALKKESAHRRTAPLIDWCHVVRLPNGQHQRVNRFDYNTNEHSREVHSTRRQRMD